MRPYYRPWLTRRFRMEAGLSVLGKDHGLGYADQLWFQIDDERDIYLRDKKEGAKERVGKYFRDELTEQERNQFLPWLQNRLRHEGISPAPDLLNISFSIQEDFAVVRVNPDGAILALASIFFPNHWAMEDKIGRDFLQVHAPIPHMQKINQTHMALFQASLKQGPRVRFAWGVATDRRLNHHPIPPPGISEDYWRGRSLKDSSEVYTRVERQVLSGVPDTQLVYFSIRTYFSPLSAMNAEDLDCLKACILDMDVEILRYKGLSDTKGDLLALIEHKLQAANV